MFDFSTFLCVQLSRALLEEVQLAPTAVSFANDKPLSSDRAVFSSPRAHVARRSVCSSCRTPPCYRGVQQRDLRASTWSDCVVGYRLFSCRLGVLKRNIFTRRAKECIYFDCRRRCSCWCCVASSSLDFYCASSISSTPSCCVVATLATRRPSGSPPNRSYRSFCVSAKFYSLFAKSHGNLADSTPPLSKSPNMKVCVSKAEAQSASSVM